MNSVRRFNTMFLKALIKADSNTVAGLFVVVVFCFWLTSRCLAELRLDVLLGFIVNIPSPMQLGFVSVPIRRKHWIAVRQIDGTYYNLDSKLSKPVTIGDASKLRGFLETQLKLKGCELLLVVSKEVAEARTWLK